MNRRDLHQNQKPVEISIPGTWLQWPNHRFRLTAKRDCAAALCFFRKAIRHYDEPEIVTIDNSGTNTAALASFNAVNLDEETIIVRQSNYLNNLIEHETQRATSLSRWRRMVTRGIILSVDRLKNGSAIVADLLTLCAAAEWSGSSTCDSSYRYPSLIGNRPVGYIAIP
ncbi:DDE domain protein [Yersinia frederiksenii ATCC 33641]|uniref:DDE domain protein n=1 Tax=Yersinia frederiksenii ATCC 33641 TaxID=349966 RepID=A0ABR4VWB7_YERFR|nr:DDE domain protein [Yersinia frederiksenii ATCC 33641]